MPRQPLDLHMAAVALINDGGSILMVESKYPGMKESFWALPGGMVDEGEDITDALIRETLEETGLRLHGPAPVAAVIWQRTIDGTPDRVTFVCEPTAWDGELNVDDPDGVTVQAAFVPTHEAINLLSDLRWGLGEPIVRRIQGAPLGGIWTYRWGGSGPWDSQGPAELIAAPGNFGMAD